MKRVMTLIVVIALCFAGSTVFFGQDSPTPPEKENPMASFMGVKWGTDALQFDLTFNKINKTILLKGGFALENFNLGDFTFKKISFIFVQTEGEKVDFIRTYFKRFIFEDVLFEITPEQFEDLLDIFIMKYGDPTSYVETNVQNKMGATFLQKTAIWEDENLYRQIMLTRYASNLDEGYCAFLKVDPDFQEKRNKKIKAAAALLRP